VDDDVVLAGFTDLLQEVEPVEDVEVAVLLGGMPLVEAVVVVELELPPHGKSAPFACNPR
jgi:hypothetical protein